MYRPAYLDVIKIDYIIDALDKNTAQKTKFSTKDFFSKCDQIR